MFHRPKSDNADATPKGDAQPVSQAQTQHAADTEAASNLTEKAPQDHISSPSQEEKNMNTQQDKQDEAETQTGGAFQRPQQMQRAMTGNFAGTYGTAKTPTTDTRNGDERRLVIGQGITMSGEIESCDHLVVEGTLEAALKGASVLEIAQTGTFYGAVEIQEATVAGRFEGDIVCHGRLTIKEGGSVTGTVSYKELAVEAGAVIDGKLSPLAAMAAAKSEKPKGAKNSMAPRNDNGSDSELPLHDKAVAAE